MAGSGICSYKFENGKRCTRKKEDCDVCCIFHSSLTTKLINGNRFWWRLKRLALKGDGDWRGFIFPTINLERITCPVFVTATRANFKGITLNQVDFEKGVDISNSKVNGIISLQTCTFKESLSFKEISFPNKFKFGSVVVNKGVVASDSVFNDDFRVSGTFYKMANFNQCHFEKKAEFVQTKTITVTLASITASGSVMSGTVKLSNNNNETLSQKLIRKWLATWKALVKCYSSFVEWVVVKSRKVWKGLSEWSKNKFTHYRQRLPHKREGVTKFMLFDEKVILDNMTFTEPKKVLFKGVNLKHATFGGTDLRGVTFIGNDWYQPKLKRNGLKEELRYLGLNNYYDKKESLPNVESTYRNIRFSLEEYKDFSLANDFFVGEMEARRRQLAWYKRWLLSVPAIYKFISCYGTNPVRCGVFFLVAVLSHVLIISYLANTAIYTGLNVLMAGISGLEFDGINQWYSTMAGKTNSYIGEGRFMDSFTYSIQTMTLQKEKVELLSSESSKLPSVSFVNAMFTLIGPILIGLLALTVRTRIKRN
jgi:uncharacterized protein YjbI with pentapeptide repeats